MIATYNLPLLGNAHERLDVLISRGAIVPHPVRPPGCTGVPYRLRDSRDLRVVDPFGVELRGDLLQANVFRLPTTPYRALIAASPSFRQYATARLEAALVSGATGQWWSEVATVIRRGTGDVRATAPSPLLQRAIWDADTIVLTRGQNASTLTLTFDVRTDGFETSHDAVIGIDVGITPMATCAGLSAPLVVNGVGIPPMGPRHLGLSAREQHLVRRLSHALVYTEARRRWEAMLVEVLPQASLLCVEDLSYGDMTSRFRRASSELGIADMLLSWLPQLCHELGVPLVRVDPRLTSQYCARCCRRGRRPGYGNVLQCPAHGALDAHANAAEVIRILGFAQVLAERQAAVVRRMA